ncbi:hypothetical protein AB0M95_16845 [Sphaerisporangium sp. NPDC051017]|uniref:hypothetical protein n=1 Tax=Sphaerisporangium sp. NPDC051017 TaxID=3154636 RepID=UPI003427EF8A
MNPAITDPAPTFWRHGDGTFRKRLTVGKAARETAGWRAIAAHLTVPDMLETISHSGGQQTLVWEDVFASGRCHQTLADAICRADQDHQTGPVTNLVGDICDALLKAQANTGASSSIGGCHPGLYAARLAPGGRVDQWYGHLGPVTIDTGARALTLDIPHLLDRTRADLSPERLCATAITQGDPTEPNIADPLCWLDYEHAGRNALAGDVAILLWYLLAMGGWLVPTYKPATYAATVTSPRPPLHPLVTHARIDGDRVDICAQLRAGAGRRAALDALVARLRGDLGAALGGDPAQALRAWLVVRILGVLPLTAMSPTDRAVCLLKLAELADGRELEDFSATAPTTENP